MPKAVDDIEGYKFSFYSNEGSEPPHVHVRKGRGSAKFWLLPSVELEQYYGMKFQEIKRAWSLVINNKAKILKSWNEHFKRQ